MTPADDADQEQDLYADLNWETFQDGTCRHSVIEGFSGPEAVRYDPDQDVWFVSNWHGDGNARDGSGFISRVSAASGTVTTLRREPIASPGDFDRYTTT